jgi:BirA family biotin operon repressor/biotin-[acetyl-CoA-carboxylase] ligase
MPPIDRIRLLAETWIVGVETFDTLSSTNDKAAEVAKSAGVSLPFVVVADMQTAGRGRGGNRWWTGEGSLAFSLLVDREGEASLDLNAAINNLVSPSVRQEPRPPVSPLLGLAAGMAVVESIRPLLGEREIGLHWPNDVFVEGRKLAGILVEVLPDRKTVLGIGLNLNNSTAGAPRELQSSVTTLYDLTQRRHDRTSILISLLNELKKFLDWTRNSPESLTAAADAVCLQKNRELHLQWGSTVHVGPCRGIDRTGALLLETKIGLQAFPSGVLLKK